LDITLDLEHPTGRELLLNLVATANALVENYSGSVLPKLGLDYPNLVKANPELVMVSMPAFGSTGPWSEFRAYGSTVEHSSGLPHLVGDPDQPPTMQHVAFGDAVGGLNGTAAILTALWHQKQSGKGQFVDLSQVECLFPLAAHGVLHQSVTGQAPQRTGNAHPEFAPYGVYPCSGNDVWVVIEVTDENQWQALQDLIPDLADFSDLTDRRHRRESLNTIIAQWTRKQSADMAMQTLQSQNITAAKLNNGHDLLHEPQLKSRGYLQWLERDHVGLQPNASAPFRTDSEPMPIRHPAPTLGQDNDYVLEEILGLSADEVSALERQGVIGTKPELAN
jgi:crotonobetainyl-CoA:carnitine CoA-transferase CaiB-like acyl-CoA transferase